MKSNISVKFFLATKKKKGENVPIYLRVLFERKKAELFTGLNTTVKNWDPKKQRSKKDDNISDQLVKIESKIRDIIYLLQKEDKPITATIIKDIYTGKSATENTVISYFELHIAQQKKANELAKGSISRYEDTLDHLKEFLKAKKQIDFPLNKINFKFLNDFDLHLRNQLSDKSKLQLERNTINKHHSRFRTILIKAVKESQLLKNPYQDFKFKYTPSKRTFLTDAELDRIKTNDLANNQSLIKVRDIFLFSVYTGLRFQDAQSITSNQIVIDKNGNAYLSIVQAKTQEAIKIPLFPAAVEIIKKYEPTGEAKITGKVLPKISNQKFNTYLKVIGEHAGIEKTLSHHVARHTCATTILLSNEAPIEAVSKWLGHTTIRTTQIYAKITNDYLQKVANKISDKI